MNGMQNGQKPKEMKPEDYILEANQKAMGRTAFVGRMAEQLFHEVWKTLNNEVITDEDVKEEMDRCIAVAEMWREKINAYQLAQAEAIHNEWVSRAGSSKLFIPTWGDIKDHFPGGVIPGVN